MNFKQTITGELDGNRISDRLKINIKNIKKLKKKLYNQKNY